MTTTPETHIQADILLDIGATPDGRFFRNTVGAGWQGNVVARNSGMVRLAQGDVVIRNARAVTFGLCVGSSDIIGWRSVLITPAMVGNVIAAFSALEVKTPTGRTPTGRMTGGRTSLEQARFIDAVLAAGGLAGVVRGPGDARQVLRFPAR